MRDSYNVLKFSYKDVEHVIDDRMGPSTIKISALLQEISEQFKDEDLSKRLGFIRKLQEVGLDGVTLISVEEVKIEKKRF